MSILGAAASVVYASLKIAMREHVAAVDDRLRSVNPNTLIVVRAPGSEWQAATHEAVAVWLHGREASVLQRMTAVSHVYPESGYIKKGKGRKVAIPRILSSLAHAHVVATMYDEEVPPVLATIADAVVDLGAAVGPEHFSDVVEARFGGRRTEWPNGLHAFMIKPDVLDVALNRAASPADVHRIVQDVAMAEGVDAAVQNATDAEGALKEVREHQAKSDGGMVKRPVSPVLADLAGYGAAKAWGEALAADLADYRAGTIGWEDVDAGCLLHGPPGTGKTMFASALAATCGVALIPASFAGWQGPKGGNLGDVVQEIRKTFEIANQNTPCIVLIDEIDAIAARGTSKHHDDYWRPIVTSLLECLDGTERREGVVVVAACNYPERLDPALVRSGRLDRRFAIELPDEAALAGILAHHLPNIDLAVLGPVATTLAGTTSGADVARIAREARRIARRAKRDLVADDLLAIAMPADTRPMDLQRRLAIHEAGHAVALICQDRMPVSLSLVSYGGSGGRVMTSGADAGMNLLVDIEAEVVICLAGRAAEEICLGQPSVGSDGDAGSGSDLERATQILAASSSILGLGGYLIHGVGADSKIVEERLRRLYAETLLLIGRHRLVVEALADLAMEKRVLGRKALVAFAEEHLQKGSRL